VKLTDEEDLRRRLHAEADRAEVGPAPVEAVFRRSRATRTRQLAALGSAAVVLAAAATVLIVRAHAGPAGRPPGLASPGGSRIFAAGAANGSKWSLAVANLADTSPWCLPGVVLDGQNGARFRGPKPLLRRRQDKVQ